MAVTVPGADRPPDEAGRGGSPLGPSRPPSIGSAPTMAVLRLFAAAREAAGTGRDDVPGATVGAVLDAACARYGESFAVVLPSCAVWRNGESADRDATVTDADEVALLPPVSGGCGGARPAAAVPVSQVGP